MDLEEKLVLITEKSSVSVTNIIINFADKIVCIFIKSSALFFLALGVLIANRNL